MVDRRLLLLCLCNYLDLRCQYYIYSNRHKDGALYGPVNLFSMLTRRELQTIERMREMSRFTCDVRVLIDGECTYLGSTTIGDSS